MTDTGEHGWEESRAASGAEAADADKVGSSLCMEDMMLGLVERGQTLGTRVAKVVGVA